MSESFYYSDDQLGDFRVEFEYEYEAADPDVGMGDGFQIYITHIDTDCKGSVNILDRFSSAFISSVESAAESYMRSDVYQDKYSEY